MSFAQRQKLTIDGIVFTLETIRFGCSTIYSYSRIKNVFIFPMNCRRDKYLTFILWTIQLERNQSDKYVKWWWWRLLLCSIIENRFISWHKSVTVNSAGPAKALLFAVMTLPKFLGIFYILLATFMRPLHLVFVLEIHNLLKLFFFYSILLKQFYCFFFIFVVAAFARTRIPYLIASRNF